ncbi:glycine--tRNA ligase subunit beta [Oceanobacillus piezotolerans]|uniref:Glycine--tRNA ligase beta subunit n=1 Tax=Oceanobacillus piezotolerans TaxID=2448030 RepID=A0A498D9Q5_9BACI|nr:glycine--tRNA ligase subunit beta [Oceanobacillus piezotolerans]RLL48053.1 glycine--tRNA ligase subunit beta [Oceanobacillus piezotolerans]
MAKDILFEIGLEELPARFVDSAEQQLKEKTTSWLNELRIDFHSINTYSTPRRLAVLIQGVSEEQTTIEEEAKGPAMKIAQDEQGNWTKAAIGFTKGQGASVDDIYVKEIKGTSYIYVKKHVEGKPTEELLPGFKHIIESIQFGKNMRWSTETLRYARPIRWLVALYGSKVIPFELASVRTNNKTYGHRFLSGELTINDPLTYESLLKENYVMVNPKERETEILKGIHQIEEKENISIPVDEDLLNEVRNLVEYPTVFVGSFEEKYLQLPAEVLITSMKEHQRYFPVKTKQGELLPKFVGVRNGDENGIETVVKGNEKVLRARLSDAEFFYEEDQKHSIDFYLEKLQKVVFQEKLGTYSDKVERIVEITKEISSLLQLDKAIEHRAIRAAEISKFDLMTNMVNEFTELQGVMGEKYALIKGEEQEVAQAVREHYLPKQSHGEMPNHVIASVVSVADKLDTIVGCIAIGLMPTGSQDPYALRRQATGILRIAGKNEWNISVEQLLDVALVVYRNSKLAIENPEQVIEKLKEFFQLRAAFLLKEENIEQDVIQAVLEKEIGIFDYTQKKANLLSKKRSDETFKPVEEAFVRILKLANKAETAEVIKNVLETESEKDLYKTYQEIVDAYQHAAINKDAELALDTLSQLADPIHLFFEHNMVMTDDEKVRNNRLGLVKQIAMLIESFADLSLVEWKQHH